MKRFARLGAVAPLLLSAACYHAIIDTGRPAGESIVRHFQPSFIYGLVPPPLLNVAGQCPRGIARVETQHTFVEGLVAAITFGIFTPMTLSVTCAGGTALLPGERTIDVGQAGAATPEEAVARAASLSAETGHAVYVRF
jgi:hypothetical protein